MISESVLRYLNTISPVVFALTLDGPNNNNKHTDRHFTTIISGSEYLPQNSRKVVCYDITTFS